MKQVTIHITATGDLTIEAQNFKGADCEKATAALEKALGVTGGKKKKPEYYQSATQNQTAGGGR